MALPGEKWRIQVLGPLEIWRDGALLEPPLRGLKAVVLVCLAAAGPRGLHPARLRSSVLSSDGLRLGIKSSRVNAVEKHVSDLRTLEIPIPDRKDDRPYVLDFARVRVDSEDFMRELRELPATPDVDQVARLLSHWKGDPKKYHHQVAGDLWDRHLGGRNRLLSKVSLAELASHHEVPAFLDLFPDDNACAALRYAVFQRTRKRLLVVEDQNMDQIVGLLDAYDCVRVADLEDWRRRIDDPEGLRDILSVDGALIDLHLTGTLDDLHGYEIANWLRENSTIPASVMTMAPPAGDLGQKSTATQHEYRLLQIVYKGYNSFDADTIRDAAKQLTSDRVEFVRKRLQATLDTALFYAKEGLSYPSNARDRELRIRCEKEAASARRRVREGSIPEAQQAVREFRVNWRV